MTVYGREYTVSNIVGEMMNGLFTYTYAVTREKGVRQNRFTNKLITGASLQGRILEVKSDKVRFHLDVDDNQPKEEATWFPYATAG